MTNDKQCNFVQEFADAILKDIPTSPDWAKSCALGTLSTACNKMRAITKIGPTQLTHWATKIGESGIANKTNPLKYYVVPTIERFGELVNKDFLFPARFSIEGMIEYVSQKGDDGKPTQNSGALVRDEFGSLFKDCKKDYLSDMPEFLSEAYDGRLGKRYTKSSKLEGDVDVNMSMLGATTPYIYDLLKNKEWFTQGIGNRIDYEVSEIQKPNKTNETTETYFCESSIKERQETINYFAEKLANIYNSKITHLFPMPDAGQLYLDFKNELETQMFKLYEKDNRDIKAAYLARRAIDAFKMASLYSVGIASNNISCVNDDTLLITKCAMEWGIARARIAIANFDKIVTSMAYAKTSRRLEEDLLDRERILAVIEEASKDKEYDGWISGHLIAFRAKMKTGNKNFYEEIANLIQTEQIDIMDDAQARKFQNEQMTDKQRAYQKVSKARSTTANFFRIHRTE